MAIAIRKKAQLGISLPTFFFAKLLKRDVTINDLLPEEKDRVEIVDNVKRRQWEVEYSFPEIENGALEFTLNGETVDDIMDRVAKAHMPPETDAIMEAIRNGFESIIPLIEIHDRLPVKFFKQLVIGEDSLDIETLKGLAVRAAERIPSEAVYNWFFEWLGAQTKPVQRQCMKFITGSSSLSARRLEISGPENADQETSKLPLAHTCFSSISLPNYSSFEELEEKVYGAIFNDALGMA